MYRTLNHYIYRTFLKPHLTGVDERRREFILNFLLLGLSMVTLLALMVGIVVYIVHQNLNGLLSIVTTAAYLAILVGCRLAVRRGRARLASYVLTGLLLLTATLLMVQWGFVLQQGLLSYVLVIVVSGILLGARQGLLSAMLAALLIVLLASLQVNKVIVPDLEWTQQAPIVSDAIGYGLVFGIIGAVSWLANREIDGSLRRARQSEAELVRERDNLELTVSERTKELERLHLVRVVELERFAEFGRTHASLAHDISNPLMAASLDLQQVQAGNSDLLEQANRNLALVERHVASARLQLRGHSLRQEFSIKHEIDQALELVRPLARAVVVRLDVQLAAGLKLYGDPVKFNQIVSNLLMNAVEAYPPAARAESDRRVLLRATAARSGVRLTVRDWGVGISPVALPDIFDPFYTNKPVSEHHTGTGIGLSIVKRAVESDFNGTITVKAVESGGTLFTVTLYGVGQDGGAAD